MSKGLQIIVFGMPGAGKTSLLGALWQVSQSQQPVLGGTLTDTTGGLAELHGALYAQQPAQSAGKLSGYGVSLENGNGEALEATLVDSDGAVAGNLLAKPQAALYTKEAKALLYADALLLLVDPTAGNAQLEKEFTQFCTLVQSIEKLRSHRNEVAGMPVYLVLTKCDMLARPADTGSAWVQKIEDGKKKLDKRFQEFLDKLPNRANLPFGKVDVRVWATAAKRPQLADRPARPTEPYGVAELFRQCFESAQGFQHHRKRAAERLKYALLGFTGLIALLALAAGLFVVIRPSAAIANLESRIREVLPGSREKSTDLLKEPLDNRVKILDEVVANPAFEKLPSDLQIEVTSALQEIKKYQEANKNFSAFVKDPKFAKNDDDLAAIEKELGNIQLPEEYKDAWKETKLVKKEAQYRQSIDALRQAVDSEKKWTLAQVDEGKSLQTQGYLVLARKVLGKERTVWFSQVSDFLARPLRHKDSEALNETTPTIRYSVVYRFPQVDRAQAELKSIKKELGELKGKAQNQ